MKIADYYAQLTTLTDRLTDVAKVHDEHAFGHAKAVLAAEMVRLREEIDQLSELDVIPAPVVVHLAALRDEYNVGLGESAAITVTAQYSNGMFKDVTSEKAFVASFVDSDSIKNKGTISDVYVDEYALEHDEDFTIQVASESVLAEGRDGKEYQVVKSPSSNEYTILDLDGTPVGVKFDLHSHEVGDNWKLSVRVESTGTTYHSQDHEIASVSPDGLVTGVLFGSTTITITNGAASVDVLVHVT